MSTPIDIADEPSPPSKKPRLEEPATDVQSVQSTPLPNRKPLLQVRNRGTDAIKQESPTGQPQDEKSDEKYFNVLW